MNIPDDIELLAKIVASLAGIVLAVIKAKGAFNALFNSTPLLRQAIKADIEILKLVENTGPGSKILRDHIEKQIELVIKQEETRAMTGKNRGQSIKEKIASRNWVRTIFGLVMSGGCGYWTYIIASDPQISNWWIVLTAWMTLAGLGFLLVSDKERPPPV
jgi:hypothetical protein